MEPSPLHHIYVIEDDRELRSMLSEYLQNNGLAVTAMADAEEMLQRVRRTRPDLILLDIGLPGMSGLQACQRMRVDGDHIPILLLSARSDEVDRVVGLEMGADDYLGKPFFPRELLARIRAMLRRAGVSRAAPVPVHGTVRVGTYQFSLNSRSLHRDGEVRVLSTVEYSLLAELARSPSMPVSRERLMSVSHTYRGAVTLRAVDAAIMRLRRVVEPEPALPRYIQTVRSHGYMFVPMDTAGPA